MRCALNIFDFDIFISFIETSKSPLYPEVGDAVSGKFPLVYVTPEKLLRGGLLARFAQVLTL